MPHLRIGRPGLRCALVAACAAVFTGSGRANLAEYFSGKLDAINTAAVSGDWETYATGYAWHLPYGYRDQVRERLNEQTWGGGFGRTFTDADGVRHSVFLMGFADSHRDAQFNFGYACQHYWRATRNLSFGGGYLAFLFSRQDVANYTPIPALLPCASVRWHRLELIGLFVPRISSDIRGDVLFFYLRMPLGRERQAVSGSLSGRRGRGR
jgi:hypothetical protein